jgi:transposase InsO family protein
MPKSHASIIPKNIFGKSPRLRHHTPISANLIQTTTMDVAALYERFATGVETYRSLKSFFDYHNYDRPHQGLGNQTPWEVYSPLGRKRPVAAI